MQSPAIKFWVSISKKRSKLHRSHPINAPPWGVFFNRQRYSQIGVVSGRIRTPTGDPGRRAERPEFSGERGYGPGDMAAGHGPGLGARRAGRIDHRPGSRSFLTAGRAAPVDGPTAARHYLHPAPGSSTGAAVQPGSGGNIAATVKLGQRSMICALEYTSPLYPGTCRMTLFLLCSLV